MENTGFGILERCDVSRPFYLRLGDRVLPIKIRRLGDDYICIDSTPEILALGSIEGYIALLNDEGILSFKSLLNKTEMSEERFDILTIKFDPANMNLINRREYRRLPLIPTIPCTLTPPNGEFIKGMITNLSAGGLSIRTKEELDKSVIYQVDSPLSIFNDNSLSLPVLPIYTFDNQEGSDHLYGTQFVLNRTLTKSRVINEKMRTQIIQYINKTLVDQKFKEI